ncbi:hypothetical protein PO909_006464 [Leuciscus waleckii]
MSCVCITEKPGQCPSTNSGGGNCVELCSYDSDCPKHEKCCSNGCGHQCMAPFTVKPVAEPAKPALCAENCQKTHPDGQCPGPKGSPSEPVLIPVSEPEKPAVCAENCQKTHPDAPCSGPKGGPPVTPASEPEKPVVCAENCQKTHPDAPCSGPKGGPPVTPAAEPEKPAVCAENCQKTHPDG